MGGDEDTAIAAAALANELENPLAERLLPIVTRGYDHWLEQEEPYPQGGGVIPRSPRDKLLATKLKLQPASVEALFDYASDSRSDVRDVAVKAMIQTLKGSSDARASFVGQLVGARPQPRLLREALQENVPFVPVEIDHLSGLLESDDSKMRYAALGLLSEAYLTKERMETLAKLRLSDKEEDIREGAFAR